MDALTALVRAPRPFFFEDREYKISTLTPRDIARLKVWLRDNVPHPLKAIKPHLEGLPEAVQIALAEKAFEEARRWPPSIDTDEGWEHFTMGNGRGFFVHVALGRDQTLTLEQATALADRLSFEDLQRLAVLSFGRDPDDPKLTTQATAL